MCKSWETKQHTSQPAKTCTSRRWKISTLWGWCVEGERGGDAGVGWRVFREAKNKQTKTVGCRHGWRKTQKEVVGGQGEEFRGREGKRLDRVIWLKNISVTFYSPTKPLNHQTLAVSLYKSPSTKQTDPFGATTSSAHPVPMSCYSEKAQDKNTASSSSPLNCTYPRSHIDV